MSSLCGKSSVEKEGVFAGLRKSFPEKTLEAEMESHEH